MTDGAFTTPGQEPSTLQTIGLGLSGLGAGIQGRGPEFLAQQQAQTQQLSLDRQRAAAEDLRRAKLLLDQGDVAGVRNLAAERVQFIQQLGGDPSDTLALLQLAEGALQGDETSLGRLGAEINAGLQGAADRGIIELGDRGIPRTSLGQIQADLDAGFITENQAVQARQTLTQAATAKSEAEAEKTARETAKEQRDIAKRGEERRAADITAERGFVEEGRKDKRIDDFIKVSSAFDRIQAADDTPAGDVSLIFAFMKMLDPGSTVREGEFATAAEAGNVPDRIIGLYKRAIEGTRLAPSVRADFITQSENIIDKARKTAKSIIRPILRRAKRSGLDETAIEDSLLGIREPLPGSTRAQSADSTDEELLNRILDGQ